MDTVFDQPGSQVINKARMEHLGSLGIDLEGKTVLEVGCGIGELTSFFEERSCRILSTDAREQNIREGLSRRPDRRMEVADLMVPGAHGKFGTFDIVFCYGTLYHLPDPALALAELAAACSGILLLETCVSPQDDFGINPVAEPAVQIDQSVQGQGCRPGRLWVFRQLQKHFRHVQISLSQPDHPQFPMNWPTASGVGNARAVFIASRMPVVSNALVPFVPKRQYPVSELPDAPPIAEICQSLEGALPLSTQEILREFDLETGHPWEAHASSPVTTYYGCLNAIASSVSPSRILEVGTAFGMSGASLIRSCKRLERFISIDLGFFHKEYGFAVPNIDFAAGRIHGWCRKNGIPESAALYFQGNTQPDGKSDNANKISGVRHWTEVPELVAELVPESFDVLFVDGKHTQDGLYNDMVGFWRFLRPGGILICDDLHEPAVYKDVFPWAGDTLDSYRRFLAERASEIADSHIWNHPHVLPEGHLGLRPFGIIRKASASTGSGRQLFRSWIEGIAGREKRLYYRDQTVDSLEELVGIARRHGIRHVVELGTLSGLSLRTWLSADPGLRVTAVDLSFEALRQSSAEIPVDFGRVRLVEGDITKIDLRSLWNADERVLLFVDAHDLEGVPIMRNVLESAVPFLPDGSIVVVDDLWHSKEPLDVDSAKRFLSGRMMGEIDWLQCFDGYFAPYWGGGSFMGFREVVPLMEWVNQRGVRLEWAENGKSAHFEWRTR